MWAGVILDMAIHLTLTGTIDSHITATTIIHGTMIRGIVHMVDMAAITGVIGKDSATVITKDFTMAIIKEQVAIMDTIVAITKTKILAIHLPNIITVHDMHPAQIAVCRVEDPT